MEDLISCLEDFSFSILRSFQSWRSVNTVTPTDTHVYLQTFDWVLVGHGSALKQQSGWRHVVIGDSEEERRLPLVVIATADPGVEHVVGVITCIQQGLMAVGKERHSVFQEIIQHTKSCNNVDLQKNVLVTILMID